MRLFKRNTRPQKVTILKEVNNIIEDLGEKMPENEQEFGDLVQKLTNVIREQEKRSNDIDRGIDEITGTDYRATTIQDWLTAIRSADQPWEGGYRSNWVKLFDIFFNMLQDTHVQACIDTLMESVQSKDFYIADENGDRIDDLTEDFKGKWFYDYMEAIVNVRLWGFGLIQFQDAKVTDNTLTAREINRKHVRPDLGGVVKQQYDTVAWKKWDKEPFRTWTIYLFDSKLGKLNSGVRWYIYKTEVARFWAKFNQLYGVPPVIAKTKLKDVSRKTNLINMLKKWTTSRWMTIDTEDEVIQFSATSSGNGQTYFENLIRLCDEQISKSLLGSTMVLDDGSSRSQSEVHESNTKNFVNSICRLIKFTTDKELFERLRKIGFSIPDKARFVWDNSEKLTMKEKAEVINLVNLNYKVSETVAGEFIGIELEEKDEEPPPVFNPTKKELENMYKARFDHGTN